MYVMDRLLKKPQNIIIKVKIKQYGIGKKESWKKVEWNIYCLYLVCESVVQLHLHRKSFNQLIRYEFSTYLHQLQPPSAV